MRKYRRLSFLALSLIVLITALCSYYITKLDFDYDFEKFFPQGDEATEYFLEHREAFETDNDFVLVGITNEKGVFQQDFLLKLQAVTDSLEKAKRLETVQSPTNLSYFIIDPFYGLPIKADYLNLDRPDLFPTDSARIFKTEELTGNFFSPDGKSVAIVMKTEEYLSKLGCDSLTQDIRAIVEPHGFDEVYYAGRSFGQSYYVEVMQAELAVFMLTSLVLVVLFLFISFRSLWGVLVPISAVMLTIIWILGAMGIMNKSIDVMLTILPTIMFVVAMSDVVHIFSKYIEELRWGKSKIEAIKTSFKEVGLATFLTSLTTAVGFTTLLSSGVLPIMDFGVYAAIGVFLAFILAFSLLPSLMVLSKVPKISKIKKVDNLFWNRRLHRSFRWVLKHPKTIALVSVLVVTVCLISIPHIKLDNMMLDGLREDDPLRREFAFFDENFAGARPFEMALVLKDSNHSVLDYEVVKQVDEIETFLKDNFDMRSLGSVLLAIKKTHQTQHESSFNYYKIPDDSSEYYQKTLPTMQRLFKDKLKLVITDDRKVMRISGSMGDIGSYIVRQQEARWDSFYHATEASQYFDYHLTGTARLIDLNNEYLAENMLYGLLIAFGVIALIVGLLFRSIPMVIISLIPNMLPLVVVGGLMAWTGIDLKVSTAIIFTIIFGIAVDDTIHFMSKLRLELSKGRSLVYAVKRTYLSTGKAILVTSIILCGGFLTLIFSSFLGTFYIGFLISSALCVAVLADLTLLPILVLTFFGKRYSMENVRKRREMKG